MKTHFYSPKHKPLSKNKQGQTLIEFLLGMLLLFGFSFFFIQVGLSLAVGNYIQYATYMAARAYLSGGDTSQDQQQRAAQVFQSMMLRNGNERFKTMAEGVGGGLTPGFQIVERGAGTAQTDDEHLDWMRGVRYTFRSRMMVVPLGGQPTAATGGVTSRNEVELISESWLGRAPSEQECSQFMGQFPNGGNLDNGC